MKGEHVYIVRCGETALKGQNKPYFERTLAQRMEALTETRKREIEAYVEAFRKELE